MQIGEKIDYERVNPQVLIGLVRVFLELLDCN